jgi:hypothetical protein
MNKRFALSSGLIVVIGVALAMAMYLPTSLAGGGGTAQDQDTTEGITLSAPVPNNCEHIQLNVKFIDVGAQERHTEVYVKCVDGKVQFNKGYKVNIGLNHDPKSNADMNGVVKIVFKDMPTTPVPPQGI